MIVEIKKIRLFFCFAVALLILNACQKEIEDPNITGSNNNNNNNTDFKVRKYREDFTSLTSGNFSQTFIVTYDASNRLISLVDSADASTKQVFTYNINTYTMDFFNAGALMIHEDFFLNSLPLIDSTSQYSNFGDTTLEKNTFDASNHLTEVKEYDYTTAGGPQLNGIIQYGYDTNGNVIEETDNSAASHTTYEYYPDLNTIEVGKPYEPRNKNLTKKAIITDGSGTTTVLYTYTYDNLNRVVTQTEAYDNGDTVVKTYTY
jgi:hypothetical protein